jgi:hypothetical protein
MHIPVKPAPHSTAILPPNPTRCCHRVAGEKLADILNRAYMFGPLRYTYSLFVDNTSYKEMFSRASRNCEFLYQVRKATDSIVERLSPPALQNQRDSVAVILTEIVF